MEVSYNRAQEIFKMFEAKHQAPTLHPYYVEIDAKRDSALKPIYFVYTEDESIFYHGFHISRIEGEESFDIQSPYSYGGPLFNSSNKEFISRAWKSYISWCEANNVLVEFIRFHPLIENADLYYGQVINDRKTVWVNLNHESPISTFSTRVRTAIRKAQKNEMIVEWADGPEFLEVFSELYYGTMNALNADGFYFFNKTYMEELLNWEVSKLALCRYGQQIVGASIFLFGPEIAEYHLSASNEIGKKLGSTNLILHEATIYAKELGCRQLHLGGGTDNSTDNSLLFFKSGFSKNPADFKIGKGIIQNLKYEYMKKEWEKKNGETAKRILFYR